MNCLIEVEPDNYIPLRVVRKARVIRIDDSQISLVLDTLDGICHITDRRLFDRAASTLGIHIQPLDAVTATT